MCVGVSDREGKADCRVKGALPKAFGESKRAVESKLLPCTMLLVL